MHRTCLLALLLATHLAGADSPQALMDNGHHKRLRAIAEPLYHDHPNDPEALWMMSFVKLSWGDHRAALDLAEKASAADPKNARYRFQLAQAVGEEAQQASILRQPGLAHRFKKELEATLALDPKNVPAMKFIILYDFEAPGFMGGDKEEGRAMPDRIMRIDPVEGYLAQVTVARYEKQENRIEDLLRKALAAGPSNYQANLSLANLCLGPSKKFAEAETLARSAVAIDPTRAGAHTALAVALAAQEKWGDLDDALARAEKEVPDDLSPYFRAGVFCLSRNDQGSRAERYFRKFLTQEPEPFSAKPANAHWRLGQALEKQGRKAEAIAEWQTAVKLNPESPAKQDLKRLK
jgi:tetratricopeptide (TPR) repeat protein